jgi:hypothetical protein
MLEGGARELTEDEVILSEPQPYREHVLYDPSGTSAWA